MADRQENAQLDGATAPQSEPFPLSVWLRFYAFSLCHGAIFAALFGFLPPLLARVTPNLYDFLASPLLWVSLLAILGAAAMLFIGIAGTDGH